MPQDVRISPDGTTFYVADMGTNELRLDRRPDLPAGRRDRDAADAARHLPEPGRHRTSTSPTAAPGEVSVLDFRTNRIVDTWTIPGGGSPDMGGVSADGRMLWLSGRNDGVVYGFDTRTGRLVARIPVGGQPARSRRLAAARSLLPGPHREHAVRRLVRGRRSRRPCVTGMCRVGLVRVAGPRLVRLRRSTASLASRRTVGSARSVPRAWRRVSRRRLAPAGRERPPGRRPGRRAARW